MKCPYCQSEYADTVKFCKNCGKELTVTKDTNRLQDIGKKMQQTGNNLQQSGKSISGCGCLMTLLITVPIIILLFFY